MSWAAGVFLCAWLVTSALLVCTLIAYHDRGLR